MNATNKANYWAARSQRLSRNLEREYRQACFILEELSLLVKEADKEI